jgi:serine protease SohB
MQHTIFSWFQLTLGFLGVVSLFLIFFALVALIVVKKKKASKEIKIELKCLNEGYEENKQKLLQTILSEVEFKKRVKAKAEKDKLLKKEKTEDKKKVFVLDFVGDVGASLLPTFREHVTALLQVATAQDEVVVRLESPGGYVHAYGLAASQLARIREKQIPLTICVDKVAASGGYMMASLGNKIVAAPFSILGSIGVVANVPNFHKVLEKNQVDYLEMTAGEYKRTLTMLGEVTEKGKAKFKDQLEETHGLFKDHIKKYRPHLNVDEVATGEYWLGTRALQLQLIDELKTSDDYLLELSFQAKIYQIYSPKKESLREKFLSASSSVFSLAQEKKMEWETRIPYYM